MNSIPRGSHKISNLALLTLVLVLVVTATGPVRTQAQEVRIPQPLGYVSDYAGILDKTTVEQLNRALQELQDKTTAQVAVLIVRTTKPLDDFSYGMRVFDAWRIGQKGKDNGLLFLVVTEDHRTRIITGYGLEGILPDGKVGRILDEQVIPYFKQGDYATGIINGVRAVAQVIAADAGVELRELENLNPSQPAGPGGENERPSVNDIRSIILFFLGFFALFYFLNWFSRRSTRSRHARRTVWWGPFWGPFGGSGGGFGGSGGGFGGFGGGASGGGGAGRGW